MTGKLRKAQQEVLQGVEAEDREAFLQLLQRHAQQDDGLDLHEAAQSLDSAGLQRLCQGLQAHLNSALGDIEDGMPIEGAEWDPVAVQCLEGIAHVILGMLERGLSARGCELLLPVAETMHDCVLLAAASHPHLQDAVSRFCELWWQQQIEGKEALVAQTIPFLLVRALTSGRNVDVKRCYSIRGALQLLDYEDPSIVDLKRLLLRAAFAPAFLRNLQGRRYLSYLFTVHPGLVRELTAIVRNQVPSGRQSVLQAYSDVLFRAWRDAAGPCLLEVEEVLQGLMQASVLAAEPSLASSLRAVLEGFHSQKHVKGVDALLLRLYEPILFRALAAPNAAVRCNALHVLEAAFPLQDAELEPTEVDELLTRQFRLLGDALDDPVPAVRRAAASVTCQVLNVWWELVPGAVTTQLLKRLAGLAFDGTSAPVRVAAVQGFTGLVDNALAQPMLKVVLPTLAALVNDPSVKVRCALLKLLTVVRSVRHISFSEIVPVEQLLDMMAAGPREVSSHVQQLLLPSYFPDSSDGAARVAALLKKSTAAGRAFCSALSRGMDVPLEQVMALAGSLRDTLTASSASLREGKEDGKEKERGVKRRGAPGRRNKEVEEAEDGGKDAAEDPEEGKGPEEAGASTAEDWEALAEGLSELCRGLRDAKKVGAAAIADAVGELFENGGLAELLKACPSPRARVAVLSIAAAFPDLPASAEVRGQCLVALAGSTGRGNALDGEEAAALVSAVSAGASCMGRLLDMVDEALEAGRVGAEEGSSKGSSPPAAAAPAPSVASMAVIRCRTCGSGRREEDILLCDGCNAAYHMNCLSPPLKQVPEQDWFCTSCEGLLGEGLAMGPAVRYLGELLRAPGPRRAAVATGRLPAMLERLISWVESASAVAVSLLGEAEEDAGEGSGATLALLPEALQLLCRASIHLAAPADGPGAQPDGERTQARDSEAAWKGLGSAVSVAQSLLGALEEASGSAAAGARAPGAAAAPLRGSPAAKKAKAASEKGGGGGHGSSGSSCSSRRDLSAAAAAEALVAAVSLLAEAPALRLAAAPGAASEPARLAAEAGHLARESVAAARKLSASPWTAASPLAAALEPLLCHAAKFARSSLVASAAAATTSAASSEGGGGAARLFPEVVSGGAHGGDQAAEGGDAASGSPGLGAIGALLATAVGSDPIDARCTAALRPFLAGLIGAAAASSSEKGNKAGAAGEPLSALSWLGPLLRAVGDVFASIPPDTLVSPQLDYKELVQEVSVLQPLLRSAKFLGHAKALSAELAAAAVAALQGGDPTAALGACQLAALLLGAGAPNRSKGRGRSGGNAYDAEVERHLSALREALDRSRCGEAAADPGADGHGEADADRSAALEALRRIPFLWGWPEAEDQEEEEHGAAEEEEDGEEDVEEPAEAPPALPLIAAVAAVEG